MKIKAILLAACVFLLSATNFKSENKAITKGFVFVPGSGDVKDFYISSTEVTNKQYRDFLTELKAGGDAQKIKDAAVYNEGWKTLFNDVAYSNHYFEHPAYDNYPVVNVSQIGAKLYCEWLTEKYNATAKEKVHFVLPTEAQWMLAAKGGDANAVYPWKGNSLIYEKAGKMKGQNLANYRVENSATEQIAKDKPVDVTAPSESFMPNAYGIYNMSGNVAELIADNNFTKGGSFYSKGDKLTIASREEYAAAPAPRPTVGFRPVMVFSTNTPIPHFDR